MADLKQHRIVEPCCFRKMRNKTHDELFVRLRRLNQGLSNVYARKRKTKGKGNFCTFLGILISVSDFIDTSISGNPARNSESYGSEKKKDDSQVFAGKYCILAKLRYLIRTDSSSKNVLFTDRVFLLFFFFFLFV